jgi:hypothetical protein
MTWFAMFSAVFCAVCLARLATSVIAGLVASIAYRKHRMQPMTPEEAAAMDQEHQAKLEATMLSVMKKARQAFADEDRDSWGKPGEQP